LQQPSNCWADLDALSLSGERKMPIGRLSIRPTDANRLHNLWCNHGWWWVHYTLHFEGRKRRIRRSLGTKSLKEAIRLRDELFARIEREGEPVPERVKRSRKTKQADDESRDMVTLLASQVSA
jgi:hypothetical protein